MYARKNLLKEKIKAGKVVMGMEIWLRDPRVIELMGDAGFDFAHIENEHVAHNWEAVENLIRTAELAGLTSLFRCEQIVDNQPPVNQIIKALKCGAQIIMVPQVSTPEAAQKIVNAAKFPPIGNRGIATCDRSAREIFPNLDTELDMKEFMKDINEEIMLWAIIETPEGVDNIDKILEIEGIDAVGFGHQDFAASGGYSSDSDPEIIQARERVREAAMRKGKLMWWNTDQAEVVAEQIDKGINIFLFSVDVILIDRMFRRIIKDIKN